MSPTGSGTPRRLFSVALVPQPKCAAVDVAHPVGIRTDTKHPRHHPPAPHADSKTFIVALGLSGAPACAEDTGCVADAKVYGNSVVQLADPIDGGYCTGKELCTQSEHALRFSRKPIELYNSVYSFRGFSCRYADSWSGQQELHLDCPALSRDEQVPGSQPPLQSRGALQLPSPLQHHPRLWPGSYIFRFSPGWLDGGGEAGRGSCVAQVQCARGSSLAHGRVTIHVLHLPGSIFFV